MKKMITTPPISVPITQLYQDDGIFIAQTHAGEFDKFDQADLYGEFNLGLHVKDKPSAVLLRRAALLDQLNQSTQSRIDHIYWLNQVHGDTVIDVDDVASTLSAHSADALISHQAGQALAIMTADCVPVVIFGDANDGIACIHAGWQGLVNGIIAKSFVKLNPMTNPKAIIGACISQAAYEIDHALAVRICTQISDQKLVGLNFDALFDTIIIASDCQDKVKIDIVKLARLELEHLGISVINDSVACSYQDANLYSYRAQTHAAKPATGRMAMIVAKV